MDPVTVAIAVASTLVGAGAGALVSRRRAPEPVAAPATDSSELRRARDRAATFEGELRAERAKLARVASLGGPEVPRPTRGRPSRGSLQPFVTKLLELGPVRSATVASRDGLAATRCEDERVHSLAALVPALDHEGLREVQLVTEGGEHVTLRRLPAWTDGAWLVLRGTSGFVNPVALDLATLDLHAVPGRSAALSDRGHDGDLASELSGMLAGARARTLACLVDDEVVARASDDGLDAVQTRHDAQIALDLWRRATHLARGPLATCSLGFADGRWSTFAPIEHGSYLLAVTVDAPLDELASRRLRGALRRTSTFAGEKGAIAS